MGILVARRLLQSVVVILGVTLISFIALHAGGDPTYLFVSERATPEEIALVRQALGFDRPLHVQYLSFVADLARGDFGTSLSYRQPALDIVLGAFPATIELAVFAFAIAIVVAIPLGVVAALNRGTAVDGSITMLGLLGQSIPNFWMGIMLILFFGLYLRWFPISGHVPFLVPLLNGDLATALGNLPRTLYFLVMPGLAVATYSLARNTRLVRSSMLEVLGQDYVRTARAKGLAEKVVVVKHALRNAAVPIVTLGALEFGQLLSGAVLTEQVFTIPGFGKLIVDAVFNRDYLVVQGVVLVTATVYVSLNLLADVAYILLNPRLR